VKIIGQHLYMYLFEIILLGIGFIVILNTNLSFWMEYFVLMGILFVYIVIGLVRHSKDHDMHFKVVVEYISIALIIALLFLLMNLNRV